jgi:hypothetical protein
VAIAGACPHTYGVPLTRWSLRRLRRYLLGRRIVPQLSVEGLRQVLRAAGCSWQRTRTWKASSDPDYEAKAARVLGLYRAAEDGRAARHGCVGRRTGSSSRATTVPRWLVFSAGMEEFCGLSAHQQPVARLAVRRAGPASRCWWSAAQGWPSGPG